MDFIIYERLRKKNDDDDKNNNNPRSLNTRSAMM